MTDGPDPRRRGVPAVFAVSIGLLTLAVLHRWGPRISIGEFLLALAALDLGLFTLSFLTVGLAVWRRRRSEARTLLSFLDGLQRGLARRVALALAGGFLLEAAGLAALLGAWIHLVRKGHGSSPAVLAGARSAAVLGLVVLVHAWPLARSAATLLSAGAVCRELEAAAAALGRYRRWTGAAGWAVHLVELLAPLGPLTGALHLAVERWGLPAAGRRVGREVARRSAARGLEFLTGDGGDGSLLALASRTAVGLLPRLAAGTLALLAFRSPAPGP